MTVSALKTYFILQGVSVLTMGAPAFLVGVVGAVALNILSCGGMIMCLSTTCAMLYCSIIGSEKASDLLKGFGVAIVPVALVVISMLSIFILTGAGAGAAALFTFV